MMKSVQVHVSTYFLPKKGSLAPSFESSLLFFCFPLFWLIMLLRSRAKLFHLSFFFYFPTCLAAYALTASALAAYPLAAYALAAYALATYALAAYALQFTHWQLTHWQLMHWQLTHWQLMHYRGPVGLVLFNFGLGDFVTKAGDRVT